MFFQTDFTDSASTNVELVSAQLNWGLGYILGC